MEDKRELYISMSQALYLQPFVKDRERARKGARQTHSESERERDTKRDK